MAMGKRDRRRQGRLWIEAERLAEGLAHPFYRRLNKEIDGEGFDDFVMVSQVAHYNGVTYTQALDPNGMRRPASYSTLGGATRRSSQRSRAPARRTTSTPTTWAAHG